MKKIILFLCVLFSCLLALAQSPTSMTMGYGTGPVVTYKQNRAAEGGAALYFDAETLAAYRGCRLTAITLQLNEAVGVDDVRVFVSRSLDGTPDYEQSLPAVNQAGSVTVPLERPYEIGGNEGLYVGYTVRGVSLLCYTETLVKGTEYIKNKADNAWHAYDDAYYSAALTATIEGESLPANVRLTRLSMPGYSLVGEPLRYEGDLINLGPETVESLTCTYLVDGLAVESETVSGLSIAPRTSGTFSLNQLSFDSEGTHSVQVKVTAVNGQPDGLPADNASREQSVLTRSSFERRKVLMEVFSTELCSNCPQAHGYLEQQLGDATNLIEVGHHAGFYSDDYTVEASQAYEWFYKPGRLYAPAVMLDRTNRYDAFPEAYADSVPVIDAVNGSLQAIYQEASQVPAYVSVALLGSYDEASRQLVVTVAGQRLLPLNHPEQARLFVMLTEDSLFTQKQMGAGKDGFYHRHSLRQMLSDNWGDELHFKGVDGSDSYMMQYTVTLPEAWRADQVQVVAFVANYDADDHNDCRVLNAEAATVRGSELTAVSTVCRTEASVRPRVKGELVSLTNGASFDLYDLQGRCLQQSVRAARLPGHGIYVVRPLGGEAVKVAY